MPQRQVPSWTVAHRLVRAREQAELTQEDVAEHLGLSRSAVARFEVGKPIRIGYLRLWADLCDVPLEWLQYGIGSVNEPPVPDEAMRDLPSHTLGWTIEMVLDEDHREGSDRRKSDRLDGDRRAVFLLPAA